MYNKNDILTGLKVLSRIMREVKNLDAETKRLISVNAGCLASDVDECEGNLDQVIEFIDRQMVDLNNIPELDIGDHFAIIDNALEHINELTHRHQHILIKTALANSDAFDNNIEKLNSLIEETDKPWVVTLKEEQA